MPGRLIQQLHLLKFYFNSSVKADRDTLSVAFSLLNIFDGKIIRHIFFENLPSLNLLMMLPTPSNASFTSISDSAEASISIP